MPDKSHYLFAKNEPQRHIRDGHEIKNGIIEVIAYLPFAASVRSDLAAHGALGDGIVSGENENENHCKCNEQVCFIKFHQTNIVNQNE